MRILLIDDCRLSQRGLNLLLSELDPTLVFVPMPDSTAATGVLPDIVLIVCHLSGRARREHDLMLLRKAFPSASLVVLADDDDYDAVRRAVEEGAAGYVPMSCSPPVLLAALHLVHAGGIYLPPVVLPLSPAVGPEGVADHGLSQRQRAVLLKAVQGKANKVIARELDLAEGTVKAHLSAAFRALGVQNRTQAALAAARLGIAAKAR